MPPQRICSVEAKAQPTAPSCCSCALSLNPIAPSCKIAMSDTPAYNPRVPLPVIYFKEQEWSAPFSLCIRREREVNLSSLCVFGKSMGRVTRGAEEGQTYCVACGHTRWNTFIWFLTHCLVARNARQMCWCFWLLCQMFLLSTKSYWGESEFSLLQRCVLNLKRLRCFRSCLEEMKLIDK